MSLPPAIHGSRTFTGAPASGGGGGAHASMCGENTAAGQALGASGTFTALGASAYDTVLTDTGGFTTGHGLADGKFTVPSAGDYEVTAVMDPSPGSSVTYLAVYVARNGTYNQMVDASGHYLAIGAASVGVAILSCSGIVSCSAGDLISLYCRWIGASIGVVYTGNFTIRKI